MFLRLTCSSLTQDFLHACLLSCASSATHHHPEMDEPRERHRRRKHDDNDDGERSYRRRDRSSSAGRPGTSDRSRKDGERESRQRRSHRRERERERSVSDRTDVKSSPQRERKYRDRSRSPHRKRERSPPAKQRTSPGKTGSPPRRSRVPLPSQVEQFSGQLPPGEQPVEKQKPNFKPTGLLAKEANTVAGTSTVLKYHEPPEARKPSSKDAWRLYIFKKKDLLDTVYLHQRSVWLMGRDQKVTDLLLEHPSISKQHAVIQFRYITTTNEYGDRSSKVKPYLIDLESTKGTSLNGKKVEPSRYVELVDQDVISFGDSEREYVMMLPSTEK